MSSEEQEIIDGSSNEQLKEAAKLKLIKAFENDGEALVRLLFYLDEEERVHSLPSGENSPAWRTLLLLLKSGNEELFANYANKLAEDTRRAEKDPDFRLTMDYLYRNFLPPSDDAEDVQTSVDYSKVLSLESPATKSGVLGLAHAWTKIPPNTQVMIAQFVKSLATSNPHWTGLDEAVGLVSKAGGSVVIVGLAAVQLSYEAIKSIGQWLKGEITGKRCCKIIIDSSATLGAGIGGGMAGAVIGGAAGPIGVLVGGVAGSIAFAKAAEVISDYLTQRILGLPKEVALENAYGYFGLRMNPSTNEINTAYRRLCLKHHPDKGGRTEDFQLVQVQLSIIRFHREKAGERN